MPIFKYQPRYQYNGPTLSHPLLDELNEDEVERNLRVLREDLKRHFEEIDGKVQTSENGLISITVDLTQRECDDIVAGYLRNLYLVADKIMT